MATQVLNLTGNYIIRAVNGVVTIQTPETIVTGNFSVNGNTTLGTDQSDSIAANGLFVTPLEPAGPATYDLGSQNNTWNKIYVEEGEFFSGNNVGNPYDRPYDENDIYDTEANRRQGAVYFDGGVGIEKDLNVGGFIYGRIETANTALSIVVTATNTDTEFFSTFVLNTYSQQILFIDELGTVQGFRYNPSRGRISADRGLFGESDQSTSTTTGALIVQGGVGIAGTMTIGGDIMPATNLEQSIGSTTSQWAEAFVNDIYTRLITSTTGTVQINPAAGVTEIVGDIRVRGRNPIGTAPVVSNMLYVTMDGDDTNDGRAEDPSRACRTIGGALKSPYYQSGTQIRVAAGHYLEDNPLQLKPYTSVMGTDLRTCSIEPINKTQDLFHMNSGCYLAFMQFLNGRSGLLEGQYLPEYNRGAYATAFPPLEGEDRIDLYHSPYIQNCTNLSGPWLKDGTMFVPNQTVQVPQAVGIGTWPANTTTMVVEISQGTIERGLTVNAGQQNQGFFNARTLLLANKPFLQEQVVAFVDQTFNTANFVYDPITCSRDVGLIVDGLSTDIRYESDSETIFSGLQYWNQGSSAVPGEETTTTEAIVYLKSLAISYANGAGGATPAATVNSLFNTLTNIITNGTVGITDQIVSNGAESGDANTLAAYASLIANKETMQFGVLSWIATNHPLFTFSTSTCFRDVGYIIDSVAFDLLTNGNKQSIKSGVYYYGYDGSQTAVPGEVPQVVAAYNFIKSIVPSIVKAETLATTYQLVETQNTSLTASTDAAALEITARIDTIVDIISNGPSVAGPQEPIDQTITVDADLLTASALLDANRDFIRAETIAYIDSTLGTFAYDQEKCSRDTGLIVDSIIIDMLQDSQSESIFAGLQYWEQNEYVDAIGGQITTTTAAINFVKTRAVSTVTAAANTVTAGIVASRFDDILNILSTGTIGVTDQIISNGLASNNVTVNVAYDSLLAAKESIQDQTINYINSTLVAFGYDQAKCRRDTGLIVDAVVLDMLFDGVSQSTFAGIQYWDQGGYIGDIANELTTTTNAILYVNELAKKIVVNDVSGTRYQSSVVQNTSLPSASSNEVATINTEFNLILNILNTGTAGITDIIVPNGITVSTVTEVNYAYNILQKNKAYIQAEAVAYVEATKTTNFSYDQAKCSRDVGYMVDSVSFDLLYSGNKQAVQSGVYYYGFNASSSAIPGELPQTTAAYEYIKSLLPNIIKGIPIGTTYSTATQVLGVGGDFVEVASAENKIDTIINIITNGPTEVTEKEPISLERVIEPSTVAGASLLNANRDFIQTEVIAYTDTLKNFVYDETKCRRDVGYMIDSVAFDLLHGGNKQSIKSGVYYYGYTDTTEIPFEIPQTTAAYNFIKSLIPSILKGERIAAPYQDLEVQVTDHNPATDAEIAILQSKIDIITEIIRNGPSVVDARIPINLTSSESTNIANAYRLMINNRGFIQAEVIAYLNTFGNFEYSREKCFRDVGILVENLAYDAAFGGNEKSVQSGLAYYDGVVSRIAGQEIQTVAAIDYLNYLSQKIIRNQPCINLLTAPTYSQVINTVLTGGDVAGPSFNKLFKITNDIITNGPSVAPEIYKGTNADAAFVSAEILMQANRKFIQEDTINYINNLVQDFPYSEMTCRRDTGLIIDSIAFDLLHPTETYSQSLFAGLQYWNKDTYVGEIQSQLVPTVKAVEYLRDLSVKIVQNITPEIDLVTRYQSTVTQVTSLEPATVSEAVNITTNFNYIVEILNGTTTGWTDRIVPNGKRSGFLSIQNAVALMQANKNYLAYEVTAYVDATNVGFIYDSALCRRDVGLMVDAICFDLLHGGNRQSIQSGLYYFGFDTSTTTIQNQEIQTTAAFDFLATLTNSIVQNIPVQRLQTRVGQTFLTEAATQFEADEIARAISTITNIIINGPVGFTAPSEKAGIAMTASSTASVLTAFDLLYANKQFLIEEVITYIDQTYNPNSFNYDEALCYRDTGLIVDAVSQDILLGGNYKSVEAGLAYWNYGVSHVDGQETTTTMALNHAKDIALQIIANRPVTPQTGTTIAQVINPFFQYGGDYMPQEAVRRNFNIITEIINRGPQAAPPRYMGGGLFALTGVNGADVLLAPQVVSITTVSENKFLIGLNTATVGFGTNATLYFGETLTFPKQDAQVEALSLEYTGDASTWNSRKLDSIGSMGGSLVDGAVISARSPIQSFVYDAFTQLTQGGHGVKITNDGYAQLVSVFTLFCSVGVQVTNGGIASIVNSNANFGDVCLLAKGFGKRQFSGQVYNPAFKAYPESPGDEGFDQYYPNGFWPNNAEVAIYVPDTEDRPHISLVMEVEPPEGYLNEQNFPGFLNANPTTSTITTGSITISAVATDNINIGDTVYIRDQFGYQYDSFPYLHDTDGNPVDEFGNSTATIYAPPNPNYGVWYAATGTVVTDLGYLNIVLNQALTNGGGDPANSNYFDIYFCGKAYYTVLSSQVIPGPTYTPSGGLIPAGVNILTTASTGGDVNQIQAHIDSLTFLNSLTNAVINNAVITPLQTATSQTLLPLVRGGSDAQQFIDLRFGEIIDIVNAPTLTAAEAVIKPSLRTKEGPEVQGAGSAIELITANIEFMADEVTAFVEQNYVGEVFNYNTATCRRDAGYIITGTFFDVVLGTNYNAITNGIAYRRGVTAEVTATELVATIGAYDFLKSEAQELMSTSTSAVSRSDAGFDQLRDIITEGEGAAAEIVYPSPVGVDPNLEYARDLLLANKEFMQEEIIRWIADQAASSTAPFTPNFSYDSVKCSRDVGYIIDAVSWDIMFNSNFRSVTAGLAYYRGNSADVVGYQKIATLAALQQLEDLMAATLVSIPTALTRLNSKINSIIDIFDNGPSSAPGFSLPNPPSISAGAINARRLVTANKTFIKEEIDKWIAVQVAGNIAPFTTGFTYDAAACKRDVGFIIDSLRYDLTYDGNLETIVSSRAYFEGATILLGPGETAPTLAAYAYLKSIIDDVAKGIAIVPSAGNTYTQDTSGSPGDNTSAVFLQARIQEIYDTINSGGTLPTEITPDTSWVASDYTSAYTTLQSYKVSIQADVITFVDDNFVTFTYNSASCRRDVGYIVDGLIYDVIYGGNYASVLCAKAYFEGVASVLGDPSEVAATIAAYNRLSEIAQDVVQGITTLTSPGNTIMQNTSLPAATSAEGTLVDGLLQIIEDVINAGNLSGLPAIVYPDITWANASIQYAVNNWAADEANIINRMIAYVDEEFGGTFNYKADQCQRDVKTILQRLIYDIENGGRYNSVFCGLSYWHRPGTHHKVQLGENVTRTDLFPHNATVNFYQRSYMSASGYVFEYVGAGTNYGALPQRGIADPVQGKETVQLSGGKVFFTSTDQNGDFRIGPGLVISQATGVLSGRTFTKSLFANMTPFILAIEG